MVEQSQTTPPELTITAHENVAATVDESIVRKIWKKEVIADQQFQLMRKLKKLKLGTKRVENQFQELSDSKKNTKYKTRETNLIIKVMEKKVIDAEHNKKKSTTRKNRSRKRIEKTYGKNSRRTKNLISKMKKEMIVVRSKIKKKNQTKVDKLKKEYLYEENKSKVPEKLTRYEDLTIFRKADIPEDNLEVKVPIYTSKDEVIELDEDEIAFLKLPPKFSTMEKLKEENILTEIEVCNAKLRMSRKEQLEGLEDSEEITEQEQDKFDEIEAESRQPYDYKNKSLDLRKRRVTDLKENSRVILPRPLSTTEEAFIAVRRENVHNIFKEYSKEMCQEDGEQKSNLTPAQMRGLKKIRKRIKAGEIVILLTDKSGKLAVTTMESYIKMGEVHIQEDREVTMESCKEIQRKLNGHMSMWLKISGMGENWRQYDRMRETTINHSCSVAPLSLLIKDHKPRAPGELPATRPLVSGNEGMDVHFGHIVSEHLEAVAEARETTIDVISTEDFINRIEQYNEEAERYGGEAIDTNENEVGNEYRDRGHPKSRVKVAIVGADAKSLYPSCEAKHSGRCAREAAMKSKLKVEGWNFTEAARYVAFGYDKFEIRQMGLQRVVPKRRFKKGRTPGITGAEPLGMDIEDEEKWIFPDVEPTELEKRKLVAACLEIGVREAFSLHLYQFGGRIYNQRDGGPIGMRLAGAAAKIVM